MKFISDEPSDETEDVGRIDSEQQLRNKTGTKYLEDVIEQTGLDYDEAVEMVERERKAVNEWKTGFQNSIALALKDEAYGRAGTDGTYIDRALDIQNLLDQADILQKLARKASRAISDNPEGADDPVTREQSRKDDQDRVKAILAAGKAVMERDLDAVEQQARLDGEAVGQAKALFGKRQGPTGDDGDADRPFRYMAKGVRKMVKGLDCED